jgi:hypothetical protein
MGGKPFFIFAGFSADLKELPILHKAGGQNRPTNSTVNEGKIMRRILSAAVLVMAFCCPISAGVIHNPRPEPTPLLEGAPLETADVETTDAETAESGWSASLTEVTIDLLAVLPALF